jgi:hypothetical protein
LFRSHAGGGLTLKAGSLCIDAADYGQLPSDTYDLDGDSNTTEALPIDLIGGNRFVDRVETNTGAPSGQDYLDMGAYEKP